MDETKPSSYLDEERVDWFWWNPEECSWEDFEFEAIKGLELMHRRRWNDRVLVPTSLLECDFNVNVTEMTMSLVGSTFVTPVRRLVRSEPVSRNSSSRNTQSDNFASKSSQLQVRPATEAEIEAAFIEMFEEGLQEMKNTTWSRRSPPFIAPSSEDHVMAEAELANGTHKEETFVRTDDDLFVWCWKESPEFIDKNDPDKIVGDSKDGWIRYSDSASIALEKSFRGQNGEGKCQPQPGYQVHFASMKQTKLETGFQRQVCRFRVIETVAWCWKETPGFTFRHKLEAFLGDPRDCWIRYEPEANQILENAYQEQDGRGLCDPLPGYVVNFESMKQTKPATGFQRDVQRARVQTYERDLLAKPSTKTQWCWKEDTNSMSRHKPDDIVGNEVDCWVRYDDDVNTTIETAFHGNHQECEIKNGYKVHFGTMSQINLRTGHRRNIQRRRALASANKNPPTVPPPIVSSAGHETAPGTTPAQ